MVYMRKYLKYILMGIFVVILFFIFFKKKMEVEISLFCDYVEIVVLGILCVVIEYNFISFYVDGDIVFGFYYELFYVFVYSKGLKLEIIFEMSFFKRLEDV